MYNLTATHAKEFLASVMKYLEIFRESTEYGWEEQNHDLNRFYRIKSKKWGTVNTIQSFAAAMKGDGKINYRMGSKSSVGETLPLSSLPTYLPASTTISIAFEDFFIFFFLYFISGLPSRCN